MTDATSAIHAVLNQSPPFEDVNLFELDRPLVEAVAMNEGSFAYVDHAEFGQLWGSSEMAQQVRARRVRSGARREILHGRTGRDRTPLSDHHDARCGGSIGFAA
jgi:hypothetical protein